MTIKAILIVTTIFILVFLFPAPANLNYNFFVEGMLSTILCFLIFFLEIFCMTSSRLEFYTRIFNHFCNNKKALVIFKGGLPYALPYYRSNVLILGHGHSILKSRKLVVFFNQRSTHGMITSLKKGSYAMRSTETQVVQFMDYISMLPDSSHVSLFGVLYRFISSNSSLYGRPVQLALEAFLGNKRYLQASAYHYYNLSPIIDPFNTTKFIDLIDQSTFFNGLVLNRLSTMFPGLKGCVVQTESHASLSTEGKALTKVFRDQTTNTFPDFLFENLAFDLKSTSNISNRRNHIYYFSLCEDSFKALHKHLLHLQEIILNDPVFNSTPFGAKLNDAINHHLFLLEKPTNTLLEKQGIAFSWSNFVIESLHLRPQNANFPLFIVNDMPLIVDNELASRCPPIPEGHLDFPKIKGCLNTLFHRIPPSTQALIREATQSSIGHVFTSPEVD